jgi:tetratricopeptide (TPR) repeat protein
VSDERLPATLRDKAGELVALVDSAAQAIDSGEASCASKPEAPQNKEDKLLEMGRNFIEEEDWAMADQVLSSAQDLVIAHPGVLANLGWARYHNPKLEQEERIDDARDLLLLSEQFDPRHWEGQYYLARLLIAGGDYEGALARAERAVKAKPDHAETEQLVKRIRRKLEHESGE